MMSSPRCAWPDIELRESEPVKAFVSNRRPLGVPAPGYGILVGRAMSARTTKVAIRLFGYPSIIVRGEALQVGLKHLLALTAILAETSGPVSRTKLLGLLWPDTDEETARTRLRRLIYKLAKLLGEDVLTVAGEAVSFEPHRIAVDSRRFRDLAEAGIAEMNMVKLREAAALCTAEFLTGFELATSPEFEDWASGIRMEIGRLHLRSLRVLTERHLEGGEWENALSTAGRLVQLDPLNEMNHCLKFRAHQASGNRSALENAYRTCSQILLRELGVEPSDQTQRLYRALADAVGPASVKSDIKPPAILFASTPSGSVAYTAFGQGPPVVIIPGYICHLEMAWEEPRLRSFFTRLSRNNRVVMFDRRGIGLSERVGVSPTIEAGVSDVEAILDAEKIERAVFFGASDGAAVAIRFAASKPERAAGLVMFGAMVCGSWRDDYPWALKEETFREWSNYVLSTWGTATAIEKFAPSVANEPAARAWWARMLRTIATPATGAEMLKSLYEIDVRDDLPDVRTPTVVLHRRDDRIVRFGAGEQLARNIPSARFVPLAGADHWWWIGDFNPMLKAIADVTCITGQPNSNCQRAVPASPATTKRSDV